MSRTLLGDRIIKGIITADGLIIDGAYTLPNVDGTSGQVLTTNGLGIVTWQPTGSAPVASVNSQTGIVVLDTDDISEGINLYYTQGRFDIAFGLKSTTDLSEGINLYHTNERVDDRVASLIQDGTGLTWTYVDGSDTLTGNVGGLTVTEFTSPNISQWTNDAGYITSAPAAPVTSVNTQTGIVVLNTSHISELTNLYWTQGRFDTAFGLKSIDDLIDVSLTSPLIGGQILTYNAGGFWEAISLPGGGDMLSTNNLSDVANAATSRTNLNVDVAGTDNSTNVSLGGVPSDTTDDTLNLIGQVLTVNLVTTTTDGAMSGVDKLKLDGITAGAELNAVDSVNTQTGVVVLNTSHISELTNLYFTDERVDDRVAALIQDGTGLSWTYVDGSDTLTGNVGGLTTSEFTSQNISQWTNDSGYLTSVPAAPVTSVNTQTGVVVLDTDSIAEAVTNLYWTQARFNSAFGLESTTNLSEGTNLYWTQSRFDTAFGLNSIGNLIDVNLGSPITNGHVLVYNSGIGSWEPQVIPSAPVTSVNSQTGIVVLDADDISDAATTNKFVTAGDLTTLSNTSGTNTGDEVIFTGPGTSGVIPDPTTATGKFLKDDGTWVTIPGGGDMLSTNNLSDVANSLTSFNNIKQSATLVYEGTIELATQAEVDAGVDAVRAVTPATLSNSSFVGENPEFGGGYAYISVDTQSDTILTTLQTKAVLTTGSLTFGTYIISWQAEIATDSQTRTMEVVIEDNTSTVIGNGVFRPTISDEWSSFSGMIQQNLSGIHNYTMKWRTLVGGTASIRRARISVWRVG